MAKKPAKKASVKPKTIKKSAKKKSATPVKRATTKRRTPAALALRADAGTKPPFMRLAKVDAATQLTTETREPQPLGVVTAPIDIPHDLIAKRAYEIWEAKIRLANDATRNWLEAEAELRDL